MVTAESVPILVDPQYNVLTSSRRRLGFGPEFALYRIVQYFLMALDKAAVKLTHHPLFSPRTRFVRQVE